MDDKTAILLLSKRSFMPIINKNEELKAYLDNRYNDIPKEMFSYKEVRYRLMHNIEVRPVCRVCGKPVNFCGNESVEKIGKTINGYRKTCSPACHNNDKISHVLYSITKSNRSEELKLLEKEKREKTCMKKYGVKNVFIAKKEQIKHTMIEKYGGYTLLSEILRAKQENTNEKRYGTKNVFASEYGKKKIKETQYKKYNGLLYCLTEEAREHLSIKAKNALQQRYQTNKERYGTEILMLNSDIKEKRRQTLKKNHTYKSSKEEMILYDLLLKFFPDTIHLYNSENYPFDCDFYIPLLDLYIEYNGSQHHNGHLYTGSNNDLKLYELLKQANKQSIINVWTIRDPNKINVARANNINLLVLYPEWHKKWKAYVRNHDHYDVYENEILIYLENLCKNCTGVCIKGEIK